MEGKDLEYLSRHQRLIRLTGPEHPIPIEKKVAQNWRSQIIKTKRILLEKDPEDKREFRVRTGDDGITRVIRIS